MADRDEGYLLDNQQREAGQRFLALAELFDDWSMRHLLAAGVGRGRRVWEVGAGSPSLPRQMSQLGAAVLATDIDTEWLAPDERYHDTFEVRRHDIGTDPAPGEFDVVHARLVLVHVPDRERALRTMVSAVRPGGVLLVEEADPGLQPLACVDESGPAQVRANRLKDGFRALMRERGVDLEFGRTLPRLLRAAGLSDVRADATFPLTGPACVALERATVNQIRGRLVAAGLATDAEVDAHLHALDAGELDITTSPLVSAWGRRT